MGKKKKASSKKAPSKAPKSAPSSKKVGGKKRTSDKASSTMGGITDMISELAGGNLPSLPNLPGMGSAPAPKISAPKISFSPSGQMRIGAPRKRSRKGLSHSDIKGFLRVNKFAGMMTKVTGKKHTATPRKRRKTSSF